MLNTQETLLIIAVIALVTAATRALPFLLFSGRETPAYVRYLGRVLPVAIIGMLVVYCLKGISFTVYPYGLPEAIALCAITAVHLWKRNNLLSIVGGTALYMFLIQVVFI